MLILGSNDENLGRFHNAGDKMLLCPSTLLKLIFMQNVGIHFTPYLLFYVAVGRVTSSSIRNFISLTLWTDNKSDSWSVINLPPLSTVPVSALGTRALKGSIAHPPAQ